MKKYKQDNDNIIYAKCEVSYISETTIANLHVK